MARMRTAPSISCVFMALCALAVSAQTPAVDWQKQRAEILRHYRALVQLDTSNPPGNETRAVEYLKKVLEAEGIPTKTFALDPKRANLVARLKGNGSKRPLLILAHTDVVGVQREKWPVDPFGAVLKDGYIWGRGTRDDKPILAANLMVMLLLKRSGVPLDRDVIFLAEAGEEADITGVGINFMVAQHFDEIDAEFSLTEGGGATLEGERVTIVNIGTAEKVPARVRLVPTEHPGTARFRAWTTPLMHLTAAVEKVGSWETSHAPERHDAEVTSRNWPPSVRRKTPRAITALLKTRSARPPAQRYLAEKDPRRYSMLRTSIVPYHAEGRRRPERDSVGSRGDDRHPRASRRGHREVLRRNAEGHRRSGGEDRAAARARVPFARLQPGHRDVPGAGAGEQADVSRRRRCCRRCRPARATRRSCAPRACRATASAPRRVRRTRQYGAHGDVERLLESSLYKFVEFTWNVVHRSERTQVMLRLALLIGDC